MLYSVVQDDNTLEKGRSARMLEQWSAKDSQRWYYSVFQQSFFRFIFIKRIFFLLLNPERGEGREKEEERNIAPSGDWNSNPGTCPAWELNLRPVSLWEDAQPLSWPSLEDIREDAMNIKGKTCQQRPSGRRIPSMAEEKPEGQCGWNTEGFVSNSLGLKFLFWAQN